jgi:hypothetical protein
LHLLPAVKSARYRAKRPFRNGSRNEPG